MIITANESAKLLQHGRVKAEPFHWWTLKFKGVSIFIQSTCHCRIHFLLVNFRAMGVWVTSRPQGGMLEI